MWNWQQKNWPNFVYNKSALYNLEKDFIYKSGLLIGAYTHVYEDDKTSLVIDIISDEALKTSEIEGEYLNRDSVQSSIRRNFGLSTDHRKIGPAEKGISDMMVDLYHNYNAPLTHDMLFKWHKMVTNGRQDLVDIGNYRSHNEPMQVISGPIDNPKVHFEAPPSKYVQKEMDQFIKWFNDSSPEGINPIEPLTRASIAHLYFLSIHPFEDGNGRIARSLTEKALSDSIKHPALISVSYNIQKNKKLYYDMLESSNKSNHIDKWIDYFAKTILESQEYTISKINFMIAKVKIFDRIRGQINERQEKVINRIFAEGIEGFKGGLSAENYISITKTSRATATRDLQDLVDKKIFCKTGELKSTRYFLKFTEYTR